MITENGVNIGCSNDDNLTEHDLHLFKVTG